MTMTKRRKIRYDDPEFGLDSKSGSKQNMVSEAVELMQYRVDKMKNLSDSDIQKARLLQLKYKMERYLEDEFNVNHFRFAEFLQSYVDILYPRRIDFANKFGIPAVVLSQLINVHREPNFEFLSRLTLHTLTSYKQIGGFPTSLWFEVYYKGKLYEAVQQFNEYAEEHGVKYKATHKTD